MAFSFADGSNVNDRAGASRSTAPAAGFESSLSRAVGAPASTPEILRFTSADPVDRDSFAYVEKTAAGLWAVRRKEKPESSYESVIMEVFDNEDEAKAYRDRINAGLIDPMPMRYAAAKTKTDSTAKKDDAKLETGDLKGVEILAVGTWTTMQGKKVTFTKDDLQAIVDTFNELSDRVKPYFKLGHEDDAKQELLTGYPSMGWLTNLRVKGDKLVTDIKKIPKKIVSLIEAGSYRRISAEVARGWTDATTGKVHEMVLTAAGLLGAAAPAITTLKDVMNLYGRPIEGELHAVEHLALADFIPQGDNEMDAKEVKALVDQAVAAAMTEQQNKFSATLCETLGIDAKADPLKAIQSMQAENKSLKEMTAKAAADKFTADVDAAILKAKEAGKLLPADEGAVKAMVNGWATGAKDGKMSFAVGEKTVEGTVLECLAAYLEARPVVLPGMKREHGPAVTKGEKKDGEVKVAPDVARFATEGTGMQIPVSRASMERNEAVEKYMAEHKDASYAEAYQAVVVMAQ